MPARVCLISCFLFCAIAPSSFVVAQSIHADSIVVIDDSEAWTTDYSAFQSPIDVSFDPVRKNTGPLPTVITGFVTDLDGIPIEDATVSLLPSYTPSVTDQDGVMLAPRVAASDSAGGLLGAMQKGLVKADRPVPAWFELVVEELSADADRCERAVFAMPCFWTGEVELGRLDGVLATRPGFAAGREVVEVEFDAGRLTYDSLIAAGSLQKPTL